MANTVYNSWKGYQLGWTNSSAYTLGPINFLTDDIKVALLTTSYTPNADTDQHWADISANEVSASGTYSAGGASLATKDITIDTTNDRSLFDAASVSWTSYTGSPQWAVLYYDAATGNKPLICAFDFGSAQTASNGTFTITWSSSPDAIFGIG